MRIMRVGYINFFSAVSQEKPAFVNRPIYALNPRKRFNSALIISFL